MEPVPTVIGSSEAQGHPASSTPPSFGWRIVTSLYKDNTICRLDVLDQGTERRRRKLKKGSSVGLFISKGPSAW